LSDHLGGFEILSLGTALPQHVMHQAEAADLARQITRPTVEQASVLNALYRRSGVSTRYTVLPHRIALEWLPPEPLESGTAPHGPTTAERMLAYRREAPPLAMRAARDALARAGLAAEEITHLITVSCTGFYAPGIDIELIEQLGLRPTVARTHIGFMGCHGAINALRVAEAIARSDPKAKVLLDAVELCSLHFHYEWDPECMVGNAVFGDGAAALVGIRGDSAPWRVAATGSCLLPDSRDAMSWSISDHGFQMRLSARVPDLIKAHLRPWLESWLAEHGLLISDIGAWDIHPGGPRILSAVEAALSLDERSTAISREVLRECGNLSSPTVLFILQRMIERRAPRPCVMLAFGPGLVAEAALVV
jgi:predicted naringenin-chalcone synthase